MGPTRLWVPSYANCVQVLAELFLSSRDTNVYVPYKPRNKKACKTLERKTFGLIGLKGKLIRQMLKMIENKIGGFIPFFLLFSYSDIAIKDKCSMYGG